MTETTEGENSAESEVDTPPEGVGGSGSELAVTAAASAERPTTVMLLGSGELSRELALAFQRLGAVVIAVDRYADAPAHGVANRSAVIRMTDAEELTALVEKEQPRYVVANSALVAADALAAIADRPDTEVFPTPRSTRLGLDREGLRRLASDELGLPTAPFWFAGSVDELKAVVEHAGFPLVVKPIIGSPSDGQSVMLRTDDIEPAWQRAVAAGRITHNRVMAESIVEVDFEVTLLTVRTAGPGGSAVHFCEPIGHRHVDGETLEAWQPQPLSPAALDAAKSIAARIVNSLGGRGVFGVELMVRGDEVYFVDVRARPQDTGLVTWRSQRLSEFELHARAILGLDVDTIMISPGAVVVSYAGAEATGVGTPSPSSAGSALTDALAVAESDVRIFGATDDGDTRRLGVGLATAPDVTIARDRARRVATALRKLW